MDATINNAFIGAIGAKNPKTTYSIFASGLQPHQQTEIHSADIEIAKARVDELSKYNDVVRAFAVCDQTGEVIASYSRPIDAASHKERGCGVSVDGL